MAAFEDGYLTFLEETSRSFKRRADRAHWWYNASRGALIILSASLPALTQFPNFPWAATVVAVAVAAVAGWDAQFKPGETWQHNLSTHLNLMGLLRAYERRGFLIRAGVEADGIKTGEGNFGKLHSDVEALLAAESDSYWKFRVIDRNEIKRATTES